MPGRSEQRQLGDIRRDPSRLIFAEHELDEMKGLVDGHD
jgi:hypothetical protein